VGRFGCSECYEAFRKQIDPLLKRIHGTNRHIGKVPLSTGPAGPVPEEKKNLQDIKSLKSLLEKAIQSENFEEAARLRDSIRDMENKNKSGGAAK
jgi:protein arginine kinase activator